MIKTIIVEDDLMVSSINQQFAVKTPEIQIVATFFNGRDALHFLEREPVDLMLLDLYMPEFTGLELLAELRKNHNPVDVIMITAANDAAHISEALRLGIVDYLVKPFQYERFAKALDKYILRRSAMKNGIPFTQADIDRLIELRRPSPRSKEMEIQKGIQPQTLRLIRDCLNRFSDTYLTSEQISEETHLSKVTVRRYMNFLIEENQVISQIDYSTGGRPCIRYLGISTD